MATPFAEAPSTCLGYCTTAILSTTEQTDSSFDLSRRSLLKRTKVHRVLDYCSKALEKMSEKGSRSV